LKKSAFHLLFLFLIVSLLAASRPVVPTPIVTAIPTPRANEPAAESARNALADRLGLSADKITIEKVQPGLWPDSCLGLGGTGEVCAKVITSGYLVSLLADGLTYEYRTDLQGALVRPVIAAEDTPPAVAAAIKSLAASLGVDISAVSVVSAEAVQWPDACLGVETPGTACAEVITPGYRLTLQSGGSTYELHTNQDGSLVLPASSASPPAEVPVITLLTTNALGICEQVVVTSRGTGTGACNEPPEVKPFPGMQRSVELNQWQARYASFEVKDQDGGLSFTGMGSQTAELAEQRAIIAWTRLAAMDVSGQPNDPPAGLLIDWRRTGGIAGVCNRLMVFESGFAYARRCDQTALGQTLLPTDQIRLLYNWRDNLASALVTASDNVADGFNYELQFNGVGLQPPDNAAKQAMLVLAAQLYTLLLQ
jgi:hypothetical protein